MSEVTGDVLLRAARACCIITSQSISSSIPMRRAKDGGVALTECTGDANDYAVVTLELPGEVHLVGR